MAIAKPTVAILAGGLATRLGRLVAHTPKSLLDVCGRPFLAWQFELLKQQGFDDVVLCLGHAAEQIAERAHSLRPASMRLCTSFDGERALGTGGALLRALPLLSDPFLVLYGDSYLRCDYGAVHRYWQETQRGAAAGASALGLMTVFRNDDRFDSSNVCFEHGEIRAYSKTDKRPDMRHIDWGLGVLSHAAFDAFAARKSFDLAELYAGACVQRRLLGFEVHERFYEIGSIAGLEEFRAWAARRGSGTPDEPVE